MTKSDTLPRPHLVNGFEVEVFSKHRRLHGFDPEVVRFTKRSYKRRERQVLKRTLQQEAF